MSTTLPPIDVNIVDADSDTPLNVTVTGGNISLNSVVSTSEVRPALWFASTKYTGGGSSMTSIWAIGDTDTRMVRLKNRSEHPIRLYYNYGVSDPFFGSDGYITIDPSEVRQFYVTWSFPDMRIRNDDDTLYDTLPVSIEYYRFFPW